MKHSTWMLFPEALRVLCSHAFCSCHSSGNLVNLHNGTFLAHSVITQVYCCATKRKIAIMSVVVSDLDFVFVTVVFISPLKEVEISAVTCIWLVWLVCEMPSNPLHVWWFPIIIVRTQTGTSTMTGWWRRWNGAKWIRWLLFSGRRASSPLSSTWKAALRESTQTHTLSPSHTHTNTFLNSCFTLQMSKSQNAKHHKFQTLQWTPHFTFLTLVPKNGTNTFTMRSLWL